MKDAKLLKLLSLGSSRLRVLRIETQLIRNGLQGFAKDKKVGKILA